jgi:hypothetical protein
MKATLLRTSSRRPAASCAATVRSVLRAATALSILALLAGCGNDNAQQSSTLAKAPRATAAATPTPPKPRLRLTVRRLPKRTSGDSVTIRGTVSRGSTVTLRGRRAWISGNRFRAKLRLRTGGNRITAVARQPGYRTRRVRLRIVRTAPAPPAPTSAPQPTTATDTPPATPASCPPHFSPAPGGCAPADNEAYNYMPDYPPDYDAIPEVPGIQGE